MAMIRKTKVRALDSKELFSEIGPVKELDGMKRLDPGMVADLQAAGFTFGYHGLGSRLSHRLKDLFPHFLGHLVFFSFEPIRPRQAAASLG